jgi:hypothetical protein
VSDFVIRRGQSVRWRMSMMSGDVPANMTGGSWGIAETSFKVCPFFENGSSEAFMVWTPEQTAQMTTGRKKLRLKFTQPNGDVKVFPDLFIAVQ